MFFHFLCANHKQKAIEMIDSFCSLIEAQSGSPLIDEYIHLM